jgi:response regulator NasT
MSDVKPSLRVAVADDERDTCQFFRELLPFLGYDLVAVAETGRQLIEQCRSARPDLVITDIKMPDLDGIDAVAEINREREVPTILVSAHHDAELLGRAGADYIMAYLVKPIKPVDLQAAITLAVQRFEQFRKLRADAAGLRQALEDRKVIERAKGALMQRLGLSEEECYRRLQKMASDHNTKLIDAAQKVLAAEEVFRQLADR